MLFGKWGIPIFIGVVIAGIAVGANREEKDITIDNDQYYVGAEYELYCDGELISSGEVLKDESLDCSCYPIGHYYVRILINQYLLCGEFDV